MNKKFIDKNVKYDMREQDFLRIMAIHIVNYYKIIQLNV